MRLITVTSCKLPVTPKEPVGRSVEQKLIPCAVFGWDGTYTRSPQCQQALTCRVNTHGSRQ